MERDMKWRGDGRSISPLLSGSHSFNTTSVDHIHSTPSVFITFIQHTVYVLACSSLLTKNCYTFYV